MTATDELRPRVLLSVQRALLGAVPPRLRAVAVDWDDDEITIRCYFDGDVSDADAETMSVVETEVMADFPDHTVDLASVRYDAPRPLSEKALRAWVYMRQE